MTNYNERLDEILKEVREASWSMGLQNAPLDQLHSPHNNKRATDKAKQAILALIEEVRIRSKVDEVNLISEHPDANMSEYKADRKQELLSILTKPMERIEDDR